MEWIGVLEYSWVAVERDLDSVCCVATTVLGDIVGEGTESVVNTSWDLSVCSIEVVLA